MWCGTSGPGGRPPKVFVVEIERDGAWALEQGDYFMRAGDAVATARKRFAKDALPRRVASWPEGQPIWTNDTPRKRKQKSIA